MIYDIGIIGAGVAGAFAATRIAQNYKGIKTILFDLGRPPAKRRRQLEGWLGCLPFGDGKLHINDINDIMEVVDGRKARPVEKYIYSILDDAGPLKITPDKLPNISTQHQAEKLGFEIFENPYIQWKTDSIHRLSKNMSDIIKDEICCQFDTEVFSITKNNNVFSITSSSGEIQCNKLIMAVGRSGWRWVTDIYKTFGIALEDNISKFGIRAEISAQYMKDFNKSHCSFIKEGLEIGPLCWNGTVIPEDHADLVISAFRSNEERWKTDKVSFNIIGYIKGQSGIKETDRLAKLAFLLFNDRVGKDRINSILKKNSPLSTLPEYNWLIDVIKSLEPLFPALVSRGYYHSPAIESMAVPILLGSNLDTDVDGLFAAGESAGFKGIMSAAISGVVAADGAVRD